MRIASFVLVLLMLPGFLLPCGMRTSLCLCPDGRGASDASALCAGMHCCAEPLPSTNGHEPVVSGPECAGCKSLVVPASPSSFHEAAPDLDALAGPPAFSFAPVVVPEITTLPAFPPRVAVRGPPLSTTTAPLRI